jgi:hypothetical protein
MDIAGVYHGNSILLTCAAHHNALGKRLSIFHGRLLVMCCLFPPALRGKGNVPVHSFYLRFRGPSSGTVLPVTNGFRLDIIEVVNVRQQGNT